jgi:CubicO group peptidase (beta-lactamase class C family)
LVIRNGYIVSETYYGANTAETRHELYSCTKSFTSTLFGIARDRGLIGDLGETVLGVFAGRTFGHTDARKQAMTLEHLLTMTTGLDWTENDAAYRGMYMSGDWVANVLDLPMREDPGAAFNYCSGCTHVISAVIHEATGQDGVEFAQEALLAPLGITRFGWDRDAAGLPIGGWGLQLTPRDMAKLGYLFLHGGEWDGEQVVSAEWVQAATTAQVPVGDEVGYGYQWWIHPEVGGYAAEGRYGQTIFVAPAENLIVVTTANGFDNHDPIFELIGERILPAIID